MKFTKPDLHWLLPGLAAVMFLGVGGARAFHASNDFVPVYTGARCLLHGCNPYDTSQLEKQFFQAGGRAVDLPSWDIDVPVYPPSTFLALSPLALLQFPTARLLWFLLNGCLFITATGMILFMCPLGERWLAAILASFFLATGGILLVLAQPAIFAISLVVIASFLFLRNRFIPLAALLFMASLAVKPQIGGLIVLYFVVQRIHWRYAAAALAGALAILICAGLMLRAHPGSAEWPATLRTNLSATLSPGGSADPRPANQQAIGDTNLQALTSIFLADPGRFNAAAYAVFLVLLGAGVIAVRRTNGAPEVHLIALAALAVLTLTPVYHRFYDTRLLLLTVPAIVLVFQKRRLLGSLIVVLTVLAVISVQFRVLRFLLQHAMLQSVRQNKLLFILLLRQQNLELLALYCLYLLAMLSIHFSSGPAAELHAADQPAIPLHR